MNRDRLTEELWRPQDIEVEFDGALDPGWREFALVQRHGVLGVLPLHDRRAAAAAMTRWTEADSATEMLTRGLAWLANRVGATTLILKDRVAIRVRSEEFGDRTLHEFLADAVGVPRVELSCSFGSLRPNQKPLVRIHAQDGGRTLGYAKIGWNPLTTSLVANEGDFLASLERRQPHTFVVPRVLHRGTWNRHTVCVTSPLLGSPRLRRRLPGPEVLEEIASLGDTGTRVLEDSAYLASLRRRLDSPPASGAGPARPALETIEQRWGDQAFGFGRWHGDWAPWNLAWRAGTLIVWDWERTAPAAPVGFDVLHFAFHEALRTGRADPAHVLETALEAISPTLSRLGVDVQQQGGLVCLYVLEMQLRFASKDAGVAQPRWLDGLVQTILERYAGTS